MISAAPFGFAGRNAVRLGWVMPVTARSGAAGSPLRSTISSCTVTLPDPGAVPGHSSTTGGSVAAAAGPVAARAHPRQLDVAPISAANPMRTLRQVVTRIQLPHTGPAGLQFRIFLSKKYL